MSTLRWVSEIRAWSTCQGFYLFRMDIAKIYQKGLEHDKTQGGNEGGPVWVPAGMVLPVLSNWIVSPRLETPRK